MNLKAIIAPLDFTYPDKRPIYFIEQELFFLQQRKMTILQLNDEFEKKVTLLISRYDREIAVPISKKYRMDALRVFY